MIVMHGETLWSPALQPMDDDDDDVTAIHAMVTHPLKGFNIFCYFRRPKTSFVGKND